MISEKASTVLATMGTVCWCVQLIPQIYYNFKRKNCEGFPPMMMFLWGACGVPFAIYFISTRANLAVQVQPVLFMFFCSIAWIQSLYYPPVKLSNVKIGVILISFFTVAIGLMVGFIIYLRGLYDKGTEWPTLIFGILASILLALGLIPPYFELAKRRGRVIGINFLFLFVDFMGAFLSMLSVVVGNMDIMGIILYSICMALELGIFASHFVWCLRFKWFGKGDDSENEIGLEQQAGSEDEANKEINLEKGIHDASEETHDAVSTGQDSDKSVRKES